MFVFHTNLSVRSDVKYAHIFTGSSAATEKNVKPSALKNNVPKPGSMAKPSSRLSMMDKRKSVAPGAGPRATPKSRSRSSSTQRRYVTNSCFKNTLSL